MSGMDGCYHAGPRTCHTGRCNGDPACHWGKEEPYGGGGCARHPSDKAGYCDVSVNSVHSICNCLEGICVALQFVLCRL